MFIHVIFSFRVSRAYMNYVFDFTGLMISSHGLLSDNNWACISSRQYCFATFHIWANGWLIGLQVYYAPFTNINIATFQVKSLCYFQLTTNTILKGIIMVFQFLLLLAKSSVSYWRIFH